MEKKNLALEAVRKQLNDGIRSRSQANVVQTRTVLQQAEALSSTWTASRRAG